MGLVDGRAARHAANAADNVVNNIVRFIVTVCEVYEFQDGGSLCLQVSVETAEMARGFGCRRLDIAVVERTFGVWPSAHSLFVRDATSCEVAS